MKRARIVAIGAALVLASALAVIAVFVRSADGPSAAPGPAALSPPASIQPTATQPPISTAEPLPTLQPTTGSLVYLRGNDLWVSSLDGGEAIPPRAITRDSVLAQYAGHVRGPDGDIDLYYTEVLALGSPTDDGDTADICLFRVALSGGQPKELLCFSSRESDFIDHYRSSAEASVSPDGEMVLYADAQGLKLSRVSSGDTVRLLDNGPCSGESFSPGSCWAFGDPRWAPDGQRALVTKRLWEGSTQLVLESPGSPAAATDIGHGASLSRWATDGARVCIPEERYGGTAGSLLVFDVMAGEVVDVGEVLSLPPVGQSISGVQPRGCAWAEDGRLAFGFAPDPGGPTRIAILDSRPALIREYGPGEGSWDIVAWLPDGSGLVLNGDPARVFDLTVGLRDLPFDADRVLAVIP